MMSNSILSWCYGGFGVPERNPVNQSAGTALLHFGGTAHAPGRPALVYTY